MYKSPFFKLRSILLLARNDQRTAPVSGYTLMELVVVVVVIGILSGIVVNAKPWYENPLKNSQDRLQSVIKTARTRAVNSTSTYRITANPNNPSQAIQVQRIRSGSCQANATLREASLATDTTIALNDVSGFAIGDRLKVGGTEADALSVNFGNSTITLGAPVGEKAVGTKVETVKNWKNDSAFLDEDLNVNKKVSQNNADIRMVGKFDNAAEENWSICINSRGLVSLFDADGMMTSNLDLVLTNPRTNEEAKVVIFPGGAMDATAIAMGSGSGGGGAGSESPTSSESPTGGGGTGGGGSEPEEVGEGSPGNGNNGNGKPSCNQGLGNGSDGCSPGNSDNNQPSNDDSPDAGPGNPGRGGGNGNTNGNKP
ncbi:pilus assembly FimT family protein [Synechocystis sp. CACIAM 05]|uniref:pilus assembly FimT family protein n=1 Tax=Synechocystis sp. CACIAM 05 TaxID=1933929 RepID=UPI00138E753E|nr:prepilin-type N-terminal cleavage/methylation domain-containing protein [Synechocystis sp. CACIAM 05]QHU99301.1 prepilin-type N-terminal cleavage/methylation domain-containing protein [Synechocystis sp. CACIAM 05]